MGIDQNECNQSDEQYNDAIEDLAKIAASIEPGDTSMTSLIMWNVSKALERKPLMDLKSGMRTAQERLQLVSREGNTIISQNPEEENLVCALLAWQQIGHARADSLYDFIRTKKIGDMNNAHRLNENQQFKSTVVTNSLDTYTIGSSSLNDFSPSSFGGYSNGPVVKLPVETKIIMRMNEPAKKCSKCKSGIPPEPKAVPVDSLVDGECCTSTAEDGSDKMCGLKSMCAKTLAKMDREIIELRSRAEMLAKREAQRSELLERAEIAWRDLERGYQRRLNLAQEKEEDITKQIQKMIEDRNNNKTACTNLARDLKAKGDAADKTHSILKTVEGEVCDLACKRLKLGEEAAQLEATLAEQQCKTVQVQRDLQFKEEQVRRKVMTLESETESACMLTHETERALRAELSGLREQIKDVSNQLLEEDEANNRLKNELEELRQEKMGMIEDLEGCKIKCDSNMKAKQDELQALKIKLQELKDKELECRCKIPVHVAIEVKRTPSFAVLCKCSPEDRFLENCSCTSMKSRLLSALLANLFGGLQSELGSGAGSQMPCQLLKCLEDSHNWDRSSVTKTNLRNYFSKLLVGELDIAIATSIEHYHAKWVGTTCADTKYEMSPGIDDDVNEGWEKRAIEKRAQKLAAELAEDLYQQRADELTKRAKEIVTSGPPPCECNKPNKTSIAYPCLVESKMMFRSKSPETCRKATQFDRSLSPPPPSYWKRTQNDVTELRMQLKDLKKDSIKKEDLKLMKDKIAKIVKKTAVCRNVGTDNEDIVTRDYSSNLSKFRKEIKFLKNQDITPTTSHRIGVNKKKTYDYNQFSKKSYSQEKPTKQPKKINHHQTYAVNMCLCAIPKPNNIKQKQSKAMQSVSSNLNNINQVNPVVSPTESYKKRSKISTEQDCDDDCKCFHKIPSNTSINELLETLTKWKSDLTSGSQDKSKDISNKYSIYNILKSTLKSRDHSDSKSLCILENTNKLSAIGMNGKKNIEEKQNQRIDLKEMIKTASDYITTVKLHRTATNHADTLSKNNNILNKCSELANQQILPQEETVKARFKDTILKQNLCETLHDITKLNILTNSKSTTTINTDESRKPPSNNEEIAPTQKNANLLNDLDYYVKFLGVTLVDTKAHDSNNDSHNKPVLCREGTPKKVTKTAISKSDIGTNKRFAEKDDTSPNDKQKKCECKEKFEEFKNFIMNMFIEQPKTKIKCHKDIALESQNFTRYVDPFGSCICCNTKHSDDSKDLEVNAFNLLEAHLKEKIKEFKISSCEASCISAEEEEQIYHSILKRVKQVISDCANEWKCSKSGNFLCATEGSWQRAYGLLREYLKMKIKRAQCLPISKEGKDEVVPDILQKVCNLIEHDFQRLKDMCKCEKKEKLLTKITKPLARFHKKVDLNDLTIATEKHDQHNMTSPTILSKSILSQVTPEVEMLAKSCDTMGKNGLVNVVSTQNSFITLSQNMSCQVPLDLGMEPKCCGTIFNYKSTMKRELKENSTKAIVRRYQQDDSFLHAPTDLSVEAKSCDPMITAENIVTISSKPTVANNALKAIACQVPLSLGMLNKCCEAVISSNNMDKKISRKNRLKSDIYAPDIFTKTNNDLIMNRKSCDAMDNDTDEPPELIYDTCNCNRKDKITYKDFGNIPILYNLQANALLRSDFTDEVTIDWIQPNILECTKPLSTIPSLAKLESTNPLVHLNQMENDISTVNENDSLSSNIPYIGTTVNCTCDSNLQFCSCTKSLIQDSWNTHSYDWNQLLGDTKKSLKNFSYIMNGKQDQNRDLTTYEVLYSNPISDVKVHSDNNACTSNSIRVSHSMDSIQTLRHETNTSEKTSIVSNVPENVEPSSWFMHTQPVTVTSVNRSESSLYYEPVDYSMSPCKSTNVVETGQHIETGENTHKVVTSLHYDPIVALKFPRITKVDSTTASGSPPNDCKCDKVPICHVKMLVENIERNLIESKCTCDAVSKVCPLHSRACR